MTYQQRQDTAVIIPARDEEDRIADCLAALAGQSPARVSVVLVVNNTTDRTAERAREAAGKGGMDLTVLDCTLSDGEGVGTARRRGAEHALRHIPHLRYLMTTDADCIVASDWVDRNLAHLQRVDVVCGKVELIEAEADILQSMDREAATLEGTYRALVQDFYARHAPGSADICDTHGEAAGASLAIRREAYLDIGGFAPTICGEDRALVRAVRAAGHRVHHADDVVVRASCRLNGRAAGGMSDALKARIAGADYLIDDCLPPADWLMSHARAMTLGPWPPQVPPRLRLNVRDVPGHIAALKEFTNSGGEDPISKAPVIVAPRTSVAPEWPDDGLAEPRRPGTSGPCTHAARRACSTVTNS
ncbi:glycosyltransferase [Gymnodinialimonas ceratoperidinii]|uniref:Glycosyltransferase n=1 Tax=Gymnodinialimonas ceratoperidinii TaxID=2856823 RepID=A0A8F6TV64_9RHOB|nr:glycosyltransferase [Gymnodinialimonas ceratoperidinii]QXT39043.1 glycosyltransferase [Gymnodinialimonas ceratoperidinii]